MQIGIGLLDFWKPIWSTNDILTIAVIFHVSMENFKAIWSYVHIMHKGTIPGLGLSQKVVM